MPNVRTMTPVGVTNIDTVQRQLAGGYQAQGFALAQTIIAATISTAQQLRRAVETAFDYDTKAREAAISELNAWKKATNESAKSNGNLIAGGMDTKQLGRIARSAGTRVAEFTAVVKAMNNGMSRETLREKAGVADPENIGFHTVVEIARNFNNAGAATTGRPADPFEVKLAKWLAKQEVSGHDAEVKADVLSKLADVLPKAEEVAA